GHPTKPIRLPFADSRMPDVCACRAMTASGPWACAQGSVLLPREVDDAADLGAELVPVDDAVNHAGVDKELGALEALGELLADGLLDDARAGEADERLGL